MAREITLESVRAHVLNALGDTGIHESLALRIAQSMDDGPESADELFDKILPFVEETCRDLILRKNW